MFKKILTAARHLQGPIKPLIVGYFLLVTLLVLTYFAFWAWQAAHGQAGLTELAAIIKELTGPTMIAFMTFVAGCFVDLNNNGVPDSLEVKGIGTKNDA